jgi:hypothetical protein
MLETFRFLKWSGKKAVAFFVLTMVLTVAVVGTMVAYIITKTDDIKNFFTPPALDIVLDGSEIDGNIIQNNGDIPVYVRAVVVFNWATTDENGNSVILSTAPVEGTDYTVTYDTADWVQGSDGFWYYKKPLAAKNETGSSVSPLISSVTQKTIKDDHVLQIQVISSAIQAIPADAVVESWSSAVTGVDTNGSLIVKQN